MHIDIPLITRSSTTKQAKGTLHQFMGQLYQEGMQISKPFLYDVQMSFRNVIKNNKDDALLRFFCHQTEIPGWEIMSQQNKIYGLQYEVPYEIAQAPINMTFYADRKYRIPDLLWKIRSSTMFDEKDFSPKYKDTYMFDTNIVIYDTDNLTQITTYKFQNCFIKSVGAMDLSYSSQNQQQNVTMQLVYEKMYKEGSAGGLIQNPIQRGPASFMDKIMGQLGIPPLNFESYQLKSPLEASNFDISPSDVGSIQTNDVQQLQQRNYDNSVPSSVNDNIITRTLNTFGSSFGGF